MKKFAALCVPAMLAIHAMSHARSATCRWDATIGGLVKSDVFSRGVAARSPLFLIRPAGRTHWEVKEIC